LIVAAINSGEICAYNRLAVKVHWFTEGFKYSLPCGTPKFLTPDGFKSVNALSRLIW
jgi:hypothetical protein